jgi:hypothetical protein
MDIDELEILGEQWSERLAKGDLDAALRVATQGYSVAILRDDRETALMFLGFVRHAAHRLFDVHSVRKAVRDTDDVCSFCLRDRVRLLRGVGVSICSDCAKLASSALE